MVSGVENLLQDGPVVINIGLEGFAGSIDDQDVPVVHIDWSPPAGGDEEMTDLLDQLL